MTRTICLHGPESVGKSVLAEQLADILNAAHVAEYGRIWCEMHGTDCSMDDLVTIAKTQQAMIRAAQNQDKDWVITDTDALMTAVWADMMHDGSDPWFAQFDQTANLYLLLDIDLPFVDDGLRLYGGADARRHFFHLCRAELMARNVPWALVQGQGDARLASALAAINTHFGTLADPRNKAPC